MLKVSKLLSLIAHYLLHGKFGRVEWRLVNGVTTLLFDNRLGLVEIAGLRLPAHKVN